MTSIIEPLSSPDFASLCPGRNTIPERAAGPHGQALADLTGRCSPGVEGFRACLGYCGFRGVGFRAYGV